MGGELCVGLFGIVWLVLSEVGEGGVFGVCLLGDLGPVLWLVCVCVCEAFVFELVLEGCLVFWVWGVVGHFFVGGGVGRLDLSSCCL
jgi:hypothetical protein